MEAKPPRTPEVTDPERLAELRRTFGTSAERHRARALAVVRRIVRDEQLAADVVQEAFVVAYEKLDSFEGRSELGTWIVGIARFKAIEAQRFGSRERLSDDGLMEPTDPSASALAGMRREERAALIREAAEACLEPFEQQLAWLRYGEELSREQVGAQLGLGDAEAVRIHLVRVRRRLATAVRQALLARGVGPSMFKTTV